MLSLFALRFLGGMKCREMDLGGDIIVLKGDLEGVSESQGLRRIDLVGEPSSQLLLSLLRGVCAKIGEVV